MKTKVFLCILLLALNFSAFGQSNWNNYSMSDNSFDITIHHDTKFLFTGDERGNHVGTFDLALKIEIPFIKFAKSYISIFPSYEYADLHGGVFRRYAVGVGYIHKGVYFKNLNLGVFPDFGRIYRQNKLTPSFGLGIEVSYRLTKRFSLSYLHQILERTDLKLLYNDDSYVRNSSFMGFKIHL